MDQPEQGNEPFVVVEQLSFSYPTGTHPALSDITFNVNRGEFIGVTGPSGAGKSTLCLALRGLIPHSVAGRMQGRVVVGGIETRKSSAAEIGEMVGIVFQNPETQIIGLTVEEDLAFGPENYEWSAARIRAQIPGVLQTVRLDDLERRETWSLSGGQKQRLAIASALLMEPTLLVLDEPTSELDPIGQQEVFSAIRELRANENVTIIMVTHAIEQLTGVADRIIVMNDGTIVAEDPPRQLFRKVDLFHRLEGERLPHIAEVLFALEQKGYLSPSDFTPQEEEGIEVLKRLLEGTNGKQ